MFIICLNLVIFGFFQFNQFIIVLDRGGLNLLVIMTFITGTNAALNLLLIPQIGILGAALSSFISTSLLAIIIFNISRKIIKWNFPLTESIKILIRSLIMGVVIWQGMNWLGKDIVSSTIILIISGLLYILLDFFGSKNSSFISIAKLDSYFK